MSAADLHPVPAGSGPDAIPVLVASANAALRREAEHALAGAGFDVLTAADAAAATGAIAARPATPLVLDEALRDEHGQPLSRALRGRPTRPPAILALCASRRRSLAALDDGADEVMELPVDWRLCGLRLRRLLRLGRLDADLQRASQEVCKLRATLEDERRTRHWLDHFDALTGLPDARRLERALANALVSATPASPLAVASFEIEHLAVLNGRLGRARVNSVLQQVAQRLLAALRSEDVLRAMARPSLAMAARYGPGTFAVLLTGVPGEPQARTAVRTVLDALSGRYLAGDDEIVLAASVGVALAPQDGRAAEVLLQRAQLAASEAVESGGAIRFYSQRGHRLTERSRAIAHWLPRALERGELSLRYQPVVDGTLPSVSAAEALLSWRSPELGDVSAAEFVPLAEESGLMVPIGSWVARTACRQARAWRDAGLGLRRIALNVSLCQLVRGDLADVVGDALAEAGLEACCVELELSERGVLRGDPEMLEQLQALRALGVSIAMDDFGSGPAALRRLEQLPLDALKFDPSLVRGAARSASEASLARASISLAHMLGLRVVGEGVEQKEDWEFLRRHGCDAYQGRLFSPPVSAEAFAELLRDGLGTADEEGRWNP